MSKRIRVGNTTYVVPDDATDDEITHIVDSQATAAPPPVPKPQVDMKRVGVEGALDWLRNGRPKPEHMGMPGSFEGHPENIGEWVPASAGQVASGVADIGRGDIAKGGHKVISGVGNAMLPVTPFVAAAAPMATARAIGGGIIGGKVASGVTNALGGTEDQQDLAGDVGNIVGGGVGVKAPQIAKSAGRLILPPIVNAAKSAPVDLLGAFSPRAAHLRNIAVKAGNLVEKPEIPTVRATSPQLEPPLSPAAEHLQNRIQIERGLREQEPFPRESEGLPEVEQGQAAATEHLRNAVQAKESGNFRLEQTPRRVPGEIAPEATRPRAFPARIAEPIPQREGLMLPGETTDVRPAKVGALLNEATGGKPLNPKIPIGKQLNSPTPVTVPKESSVIQSHSYDPNTNELTLTTHSGQTYKYGDVSPDQAAEFANGSKGQALNRLKKSGSVLVEKNGKPVTPTGPRMATPNDLTPILKESVRIAKAKK